MENIKTRGQNIIKTIIKQKAVVAVLVILILMLFPDTNFYSSYNLINVLRSTSVLEIIGFGVTLTIIAGGVDLSVGGMVTLSGILVIKLMDFMPMVFAILCVMLVGAIIGIINGFLTVHQKTEAFIITLGMGMLLKGIALVLSNAHPVVSTNPVFVQISNGLLFNTVPYLVIYMLVLLVATHCVLRYTKFGRNCYAIGGDYNVAAYSGINVVSTKWVTYIICGVLAALAGVLFASSMNTGSPTCGDAIPLLVFCGVVVGGTSFSGGVGGAFQSFFGLLVLQMLSNCMNMLGIGAYLQQALQGIVIVTIIWMDCFADKRKREAV